MQGLLLLQEKFVLAKFAITILRECYYQKHFLSLHCPKGQDILDESVSLLSLIRNLTVSSKTRITTTLIICFGMCTLFQSPHTEQVWGIVLVYSSWVLSEPLIR